MNPTRQLEELGLSEAAAWARRTGATHFADLWETSPRGDWLVRVALEVDVDRIAIVRAAVTCAGAAVRRGTEDDARPEKALRAAIRWTEGTATGAECWAAAFASNAAAETLREERARSAARAAASAAFACDWDADVAYYAQRGHAAEAVVRAAPAIAELTADGHRVAAALVRDAIPFSMIEGRLRSTLSKSSFPPPAMEAAHYAGEPQGPVSTAGRNRGR